LCHWGFTCGGLRAAAPSSLAALLPCLQLTCGVLRTLLLLLLPLLSLLAAMGGLVPDTSPEVQ
jgi:hypothetical protein